MLKIPHISSAPAGYRRSKVCLGSGLAGTRCTRKISSLVPGPVVNIPDTCFQEVESFKSSLLKYVCPLYRS